MDHMDGQLSRTYTLPRWRWTSSSADRVERRGLTRDVAMPGVVHRELGSATEATGAP